MPKNKDKPTKEYKDSVNYIRKLKGEIRKLVKENSYLRKQLAKTEHLIPEETIEPETPRLKIKGNPCPNCGAEGTLTTLKLGPKILTVCKECKYRKAA